MKTLTIAISSITAFIISAGGSMGIAFIATNGVMPGKAVWVSAVVLGLVSAAKDTRSLLQLPPVSNDKAQ